MFILCSYFVFDRPFKFRFKTQWVFIVFIDCILFLRKMKKSGELSIDHGKNSKIEKTPRRIYAIYEHYEQRVFWNGVAGVASG